VSLHLRARVGPYQVLIAAASVLEVGSGAAVPRSWRGRTLPYVDAYALLGLERSEDGAGSYVIYGAGAEAVVLGLGPMAGAVPVAREEIRPFPPSMAQAHRLFDGVVVVADEAMLRLRDGLDLAALSSQPSEARRLPT
jgi:chemotaxis signal transduction protein